MISALTEFKKQWNKIKHIRISVLCGNSSSSGSHNTQWKKREKEWFGDSSSGEERESISGQELSKDDM